MKPSPCTALRVLAIITLVTSRMVFAQPTPLPGAVHVELFSGTDGRLKALVESTATIELDNLSRSEVQSTNSGVVFYSGTIPSVEASQANVPGKALGIFSAGSPVILSVREFPGWTTSIPKRSRVLSAMTPKHSTVEVFAGPANQQSLNVSFPDGASIVMPANSSAKVGYLKDNSYFCTTTGPAVPKNAEGQTVRMDKFHHPMVGGPLNRPSGTNTTDRFSRAQPWVEVKIKGSLTTNVFLEIGGKSQALTPGENLELVADNGAKMQVLHDKAGPALNLLSLSGVFRLSLDGIPGWQSTLQAGQSTETLWDKSARIIDQRNTSESDFLTTTLPNRTSVAIQPGATFQFGYINPSTFVTAASGGEVRLLNLDTDQETNLERSNLTFLAGRVKSVVPPTNKKPPFPLVFTWDIGQPLDIIGFPKPTVVRTNTEIVLAAPNGSRVSIKNDEEGTVASRAVTGDFSIRLAALNGLTILLAEGNAVTMTLDLKKGRFVLRTAEDNASTVQVTTAEGFSSQLTPNSGMNFNLGKDGTLFGFTSSGAVAFVEGSGSGGATGSGTTVGVPTPGGGQPLVSPDQLGNTPGIDENPLSVNQ